MLHSQDSMKNIYNKIQDLSDNLFKELTEIRRYLHKHPELGRQEYQTSKYIRNKIEEIGNFKITMVGETGFTADLIQNDSYPWLALRADMDALPIQDEKNVSYKSVNENCSHACGHDFHSTVVIGAANVLYQLKDSFKGNIRFLFQHAEEPIPGGALDFVNQNLLDGIDCIFGFHADPSLKTKTIGLLPGWNSAQSVQWKIIIKGKGGHSSRPQNAVDPIFIGVTVLNELYSALYRKLDANNPFVFTVGKISSGENYNVIPELFEAEGTLRTTSVINRDELLEIMDKNLKIISEKYGTLATLDYNIGSPPVNNDFRKTELVKKYLEEILGENQFIDVERSMGGEDFGYFQTVIPGVFIKVGVRKGEEILQVHTSKFNIDEDAIPFSVSLMSFILVKYFNELNGQNKRN
jgi:amidohydrolase